jgi:Flp pilus assembly protein TadD
LRRRRKRFISAAPLLLLASCAGRPAGLSDRPPGLDVADVALAHGSPETALHVAQAALARDGRDVRALVEEGRALAALGRRQEAAAAYAQAAAAAPDDLDAAMGLGRLLLQTDPAAAAETFARAREKHPGDVALLVDAGIADDLLGRHEAAQREYRAALAAEPGRTAASVNLGLSLALSGRSAEALSILRPLAADPAATPRIRQDLAAALALAGDATGAAAVLDQYMAAPQVAANVAAFRSLSAP